MSSVEHPSTPALRPHTPQRTGRLMIARTPATHGPRARAVRAARLFSENDAHAREALLYFLCAKHEARALVDGPALGAGRRRKSDAGGGAGCFNWSF